MQVTKWRGVRSDMNGRITSVRDFKTVLVFFYFGQIDDIYIQGLHIFQECILKLYCVLVCRLPTKCWFTEGKRENQLIIRDIFAMEYFNWI